MQIPTAVRAMALIPTVLACQANLSALPTLANPSSQTQTFNDTSFEMESCEITPDRTAVCKLNVTNRFRDKKLEVDRRITIQDNLGTDYAVSSGGFGDPPGRANWSQVAIADSSYPLTVIAKNLSTQATSIRAVVFTRLLVRSTQGQALGYRDQAIFSNPPMIAASSGNSGRAGGSNEATGTSGFAGRGWVTVGYWNYDGADGQNFAQGLVLRSVPGSGMGQTWSAHIELRNHASLPARHRTLWPVAINTTEKRICANYPGYPSYSVYVDMPGESQDGVYAVAECSGG